LHFSHHRPTTELLRVLPGYHESPSLELGGALLRQIWLCPVCSLCAWPGCRQLLRQASPTKTTHLSIYGICL
jgi:hypothetical protein